MFDLFSVTAHCRFACFYAQKTVEKMAHSMKTVHFIVIQHLSLAIKAANNSSIENHLLFFNVRSTQGDYHGIEEIREG